MNDKARAAMREYKRRWREKNPGKDKEYNEKYWAKKFDEMQKGQSQKDTNANDTNVNSGQP